MVTVTPASSFERSSASPFCLASRRRGDWRSCSTILRLASVAATDANRKIVEQERQSPLRREAKQKGEAEDLSKLLAGVTVTIAQKAGENDQLFGSVTSKDVADALAQKNFTIDRRKVLLDEPIKQLGEFKVPVRLHREVTAEVTVQVVKEE